MIIEMKQWTSGPVSANGNESRMCQKSLGVYVCEWLLLIRMFIINIHLCVGSGPGSTQLLSIELIVSRTFGVTEPVNSSEMKFRPNRITMTIKRD